MKRAIAAAALAVAAIFPVHAQWAVIGPAVSKHVVEQGDVPDGRAWNERNRAIGLQYTQQLESEGWARRYFAEVVVDSFATTGVLSGVSLQRKVSPDTWPVRVEAGLSLNVWRRQVNWGGTRRTVLCPLPVFTFTHVASGWGINAALTPRIEHHGDLVSPVTLMAQIFKQF